MNPKCMDDSFLEETYDLLQFIDKVISDPWDIGLAIKIFTRTAKMYREIHSECGVGDSFTYVREQCRKAKSCDIIKVSIRVTEHLKEIKTFWNDFRQGWRKDTPEGY